MTNIPTYIARRDGIGSAKFISVATTKDTLAEISAKAKAVAEKHIVNFDMPKFTPEIKYGSLDIPAGAKSPGREKGRRLWALAYFTSCALFDLPVGSVYIPCYICGDLFDAWTMDGEHVIPSRNGEPKKGVRGNLLLSCHCCNNAKLQGQVTGSAKELAEWAGRKVDYPRGSDGILPMWRARTRRTGHYCSTRYVG